ncbi:unnamed protein product [marine sediment metagenome]|uniref:Uncharacterized protein n=1 Tax=marine sediment metagenome TaxID=412755 RepID=X0Y1G0_9ZZZZ
MAKRKIKLPVEEGLCKDCRWRFRRVFVPTNPEEFEDEEGNKLLEDFDGRTDSIVINICILSEMDLDADITTECSHYTPWNEEKEDISIFKHKIK